MLYINLADLQTKTLRPYAAATMKNQLLHPSPHISDHPSSFGDDQVPPTKINPVNTKATFKNTDLPCGLRRQAPQQYELSR